MIKDRRNMLKKSDKIFLLIKSFNSELNSNTNTNNFSTTTLCRRILYVYCDDSQPSYILFYLFSTS